jgi:hypothetical protein
MLVVRRPPERRRLAVEAASAVVLLCFTASREVVGDGLERTETRGPALGILADRPIPIRTIRKRHFSLEPLAAPDKPLDLLSLQGDLAEIARSLHAIVSEAARNCSISR